MKTINELQVKAAAITNEINSLFPVIGVNGYGFSFRPSAWKENTFELKSDTNDISFYLDFTSSGDVTRFSVAGISGETEEDANKAMDYYRAVVEVIDGDIIPKFVAVWDAIKKEYAMLVEQRNAVLTDIAVEREHERLAAEELAAQRREGFEQPGQIWISRGKGISGTYTVVKATACYITFIYRSMSSSYEREVRYSKKELRASGPYDVLPVPAGTSVLSEVTPVAENLYK